MNPVRFLTNLEYVRLYSQWLLVDSISQQFQSFEAGFRLVCSETVFQFFLPDELELVICGRQE